MNPTSATGAQLEAARRYIKQSWRTLTRSNAQLAASAIDPKFKTSDIARWTVYVSRRENLARVEQELRGQMKPEDFAHIEICQLPESLTDALNEPGLLYLPHPYVVPGGRFNEMYGWDSYFIQVGLLRDGEDRLAKDMVENFLYEIEHYGVVLNANRSYYLTRSQPPFLTQMILNVFRRTHDKAWLASTLPAIEKYYRYWTKGSKFIEATGLSRYYDFGEGPAPEVIADERDAHGLTHYDRIKEFYRTHEIEGYDLRQYFDTERAELTLLFYKGDRSMRESGFDPSNRFGEFNIDIIHYNPVCLNSLLYLMEIETARILTLLDRPRDAHEWTQRAAERQASINGLMWDDADGFYYDYNFINQSVRRYPFVTTFYPLWSGIASNEQAARIVANLPQFERGGGLQTSTNKSGSQWDSPFGWGNLQMIAVEGLRRYGYAREANRITTNFLSMILKDFIEHNTIVEKYDVERRTSTLGAGVKFGYDYNVVGFGWTNAAFTELYAELPESEKPRVLKLDGVVIPPPVEKSYSVR